MKGFIIQPTYTNLDGQTYVLLFGRLENGESFVSKHLFNPYFFVREKDLDNLEALNLNVKKEDFHNFQGEKVVKIIFELQSEMNKIRGLIHDLEIDTYEADLKPHYRFMMDNELLGSVELNGEYDFSDRVDRIYNNPEIFPSDFVPTLKTLSIDIEAGKDEGELFCIGLSSKNYKKCFIVGKKNLKDSVFCESVEDCLEKFKEELISFDPDIITGWNVIDFDFVYLKKLFEKFNIRFDLGRTNDKSKIRVEQDFFKNSKMEVSGRVVLDGLNFIKDPYIKEAPSIKEKSFESYTLDNVAMQMIGRGKLIKGKERHEEIIENYLNDPQKLVDYNLIDCELVYEILEKSKMIELAIERSQLTGMPLDRIGSSIASFDSLYIREARKLNLVSPTTRFIQKAERIKGGFVMSPKPGIYYNVQVFDFKSMYPSIIRTFNIDPASFLSTNSKGCIEAPNGACFKNSEGLLPKIIEKLHFARELAKKEGREFSSYAIKIIMNSFFGVLASPNCRYFNLDMANAITNFAQDLIKRTSLEIEKKGLKVIYGDTDSVFVDTNLEEKKAKIVGKEIEIEINEFYKKYVSKNFNRKSFLELEFEKLYSSLLFPKNRGTGNGAKKRYAGKLTNGEIQITGLEAIRGDWTEAAKEFQMRLLEIIFDKKDSKKFIKEFINNLKSGKMDLKLIYRKQLRKNLEEYTKTTPPHVKAARKLKKLEGNIIEYFITLDGPEPVIIRTHKLDYNHYIDKQIKPIANSILDLFNLNLDEVLSGEKQQTLF